MMVTRKTHPDHPRLFSRRRHVDHRHRGRSIGCIYLFSSLQTRTMVSVLIWNVIGLAIYLLWARRKSLLEPAPAEN